MNLLRQLLAVAMLAMAAVAHQHLACVGAPEFQHYFSPSPQSCAKYVLCLNGEAHIDRCQDGLHFDVSQQGCGNAQFVDCAQCGPYGFVKLPHAEDCAQYYECTFGQRKQRTCPAGLLFDRTVGACNTDFMVTTCPGSDYGDYGDYGDGSPPLEPPGDGTDPDLPDDGGSLPSCTTGQVHHAHGSNCRRYFMCIRGVLWEHMCPSRLHWNERAMACDMPKHAGCLSSDTDTDYPGGPDYPSGPDGPEGPPSGPGKPTDPEFPEWTSGRPGKKPNVRPTLAGKQRPGIRGTEPIRRLVRRAAA